MPSRAPLTRDRIVDAAARVADHGGAGSVSMRRVAQRLGVEAMSLYHHVAGKEQLIDLLADWAFARIEVPTATPDWRTAMVVRADSARAVLGAHPWALGLIESRRDAGPALLRHHDRVLGILRAADFSVADAAHAFSVLDAYVYGFVLTETRLPFEPGEGAVELTGELALDAASHPHLTELVTELVAGGAYDFGSEFAHGLTIILDQLELRRQSAALAQRPATCEEWSPPTPTEEQP